MKNTTGKSVSQENTKTRIPRQKRAIEKKEKIDFLEGKAILNFYLETSTQDGSYSVSRCLFKASALSLGSLYNFLIAGIIE